MEKIIEVIQYAVIAIVQGISETLPISSSGHIKIFKTFFNLPTNDITYDIFLHFASLISLLFFFRKKIARLFKGFFLFFKNKNEENRFCFHYGISVIIASIPAGIVGILLEDKIETLFSKLIFVGILLIINGIIIYFVHHWSGKKSSKKEISFMDALIIGGFQGIGILPGISRSGITINGGLLRGINRDDAAEFAFMMFIPVALGSSLLKLKDFINVFSSPLLLPYLIGFIIALGVTYFSLKFFLKVIKKGKFVYFAYYCILLGAMVTVSSFLF